MLPVEEQRELLREVRETPAFREVILPGLDHRLEELAHRLCIGTNLSLEEVRALQVRHAMLLELRKNFDAFFIVKGETDPPGRGPATRRHR